MMATMQVLEVAKVEQVVDSFVQEFDQRSKGYFQCQFVMVDQVELVLALISVVQLLPLLPTLLLNLMVVLHHQMR